MASYLNGLLNAIWIFMMNNKSIKISINNKPYPVPVEMRPLWRIGLVVLIVKRMNLLKKSVDLKKLNVTLWMLIRSHDWEIFQIFLNSNSKTPPFITSDQANYIAIELAFNKELIKFNEEKIITTKNGDLFFNFIIENSIFSNELNFINQNSSSFTNVKIDQIMGKK